MEDELIKQSVLCIMRPSMPLKATPLNVSDTSMNRGYNRNECILLAAEPGFILRLEI